MDCPRCNTTLEDGIYAEESVSLCPNMDGLLIQQKNLTKLLDRLMPDFASSIDTNSPIKVVEDRSPIEHCPSCNHKTDYYGYMEANIAMIDFCPNCNWIWIDTSELQAIAKMYAQFHKIKPSIERNHGHRSTDVLGAHLAVEAVAKALMGL